jgi:glycine hydroxymethyltransferase
MGTLKNLKSADPEIFKAVKNELKRQRNSLVMIPSENYASVNVLNVLGSVLNNKYSEGYPNKRYYAGNEFADMVESIAIERTKGLFKVPHANVQPYSGSPANFAVYAALCNPGDTVMGIKVQPERAVLQEHTISCKRGRPYRHRGGKKTRNGE